MYKQKRLSRIALIIRYQTYFVTMVPFLILGMYLLSILCFAADSVTATKNDYGTTPATFTITYAQEIQWEANYMGSGTEGNDYKKTTT